MIAEESEQYKGYKKGKFIPVSGCCYKVWNPNDDSNNVFDLEEYHVDTLP